MPELDAIAAVVREAGAHAMTRFGGDFKRWHKSAGEVVTELDIEIDTMLRERLYALDPEAGWLSEETADSADRLLGHRVWVVDPIDGTRDFARGRPGWCISVALVEGGRVIAGVLDAPARDEHWAAAAGQGATLNWQPLCASTRQVLPGARVPADVLPKVDADLVAVEKPNSIALRIAMVGADRADLLATLSWGHEWDIAAAVLIAQEAGATVSDALGAPLRFNSTKGEMFGVLASAPAIHAAAVERLAERARRAVVR